MYGKISCSSRYAWDRYESKTLSKDLKIDIASILKIDKLSEGKSV